MTLNISDGRQQLPNDAELQGLRGLQGRTVLLWGAEDAQFLYAQVAAALKPSPQP